MGRGGGRGKGTGGRGGGEGGCQTTMMLIRTHSAATPPLSEPLRIGRDAFQ